MLNSKNILLFILIIIIVIIYLFNPIEGFSNCAQYGVDYNRCYNNNRTIMLDNNGIPFCVDKYLYEDT